MENSYFSIPVVALYQLNNRVSFSAGPFVSFATNRNFSGYVYDGYLREINPTGTKVEFSGDNRASYDFSDNLRKFQWGAQIGTEWKAFKHLIVYADLTWGIERYLPKGFRYDYLRDVSDLSERRLRICVLGIDRIKIRLSRTRIAFFIKRLLWK